MKAYPNAKSVIVKIVLSLEIRLPLVEKVFRSEGEHIHEVQQKSAEIFLDTPAPHHNSVRRFIVKFHETGSSTDVPSSGRQPVLTEKRLDVSDHILQIQTTPYGKMQQQTDVS
jgi:hypothetical protein